MTGAFARALEELRMCRRNEIAVFSGGIAEMRNVRNHPRRIETVAPGFEGERWIGDHEVEGLEPAIGV